MTPARRSRWERSSRGWKGSTGMAAMNERDEINRVCDDHRARMDAAFEAHRLRMNAAIDECGEKYRQRMNDTLSNALNVLAIIATFGVIAILSALAITGG